MSDRYGNGGIDRRKQPRINKHLPVSIMSSAAGHNGTTRNVSGNGVFIRFPDEVIRTFVAEQPITLLLSLPDGDACRLVGKVSRIVSDNPLMIRKGIGVEILGGHGPHLSRYKAFVKDHLI